MNRRLVLAAFVAVFAACSSAPKSKVSSDGEMDRTLDQQAIGKKFIESLGIGGADPALQNKTQRMATSRNAAIAAAQHELLQTIKGTRVTGGITVEKAMETDSKITTSLDESIKGAEIVKTEWTSDDGCIVTMRIERDRLQKMMGVRFE